MRLFQFSYSPYAAKVRMALRLKQLPHELVEVPYVDRKALVAATGGVGIPVLVDGDTVVHDSPRILEYLEEKGGPPLRSEPLALLLEQWSDGPLEDAAFRLACPGLEDRIGADQGEEARLLFRLIKERRYGTGAVAQWRSEEATWKQATLRALAPVKEALASKPFLFGNAPTVADLAIAGQLVMVESALPRFVERELPELQRWFSGLAGPATTPR